MGGSGFDLKFSSDLFLLSSFSSPGVHSAYNRNEYQGISLVGKVRPELKADSSIALVMLNVKIRLENAT
jgi:hypothetical protein